MAHWYNKKGDCVYTVPYADASKGMRDTTMGDARKLKLVPSVTTIIGQLDKPAVTQWRINNILEECYITNIQDTLDGVEYKKEVLKHVKKREEMAPKLGSKVHDELEQWYKSGANDQLNERIAPTVFTVREQIGKVDYIPEVSFAHSLGFGGKVDLHWKAESKQHLGIVLDFKTKDTLDRKKMKGYSEHIMQLAAYRHGLGVDYAECFNVFISTQDFNIIEVVQYKESELERHWEMFKCLLKYWQLSNKFGVY